MAKKKIKAMTTSEMDRMRDRVNRYVVVRNLPRYTTVKDIRNWFSKYGTITHVRHALPERSLALVAFETLPMAQSLMEQQGKLKINGDLINLRLLDSGYYKFDEAADCSVELTVRTNNIEELHNGCEQAVLANGAGETIRLLKCLEPARGYASSMVSLYLHNEESSKDSVSVDLVISKLECEYRRILKLETPEKGLPFVYIDDGPRAGPSSRNLAATQESIKTIKRRLQLNGATSTRGRVIFCGTVFADGGEVKQVLIEFEPYTLISDKSFCFFDNKFHLGPLAFRLIHYEIGDGLGASDFKKVTEAIGDDLEKSLTSFNIDAPSRCEPSNPIYLSKKDCFLLRPESASSDILREVRVAETTRVLRLMESLRVSGDDYTKKMILIVEAQESPRVTQFLKSSSDLNKAKSPRDDLMLDSDDTPEWHKAAERLLKVGSFPRDSSAKRCLEFAEEQLNLYSGLGLERGFIVYCALGMSVGGREMKFWVDIEPRRPVRKSKVIYIPNGRYDLKPLEELVFLENDLVPFALDPKNAPQGIMSHEKRDLLIRLVEELANKPVVAQQPPATPSWPVASKPAIAQSTQAPTGRPIVSRTRRLAEKVRRVFLRLFN